MSFLNVDNLYVNAMPPSASTTAAYFKLTNTSSQKIIFKSATSPIANQVELHKTTVNNGTMKMRRAHDVAIEGNGVLELSPGGYHLMLTELKQSLKPSEHVPITLLFNDSQQLTLHAVVRDIRNQDNHHNHHHHH